MLIKFQKHATKQIKQYEYKDMYYNTDIINILYYIR